MKYDCQRAYLCGLTMNHIKTPQPILKCLYEPHRVSGRFVSDDYYNEIKFPVGRRKTEYGSIEERIYRQDGREWGDY